MTAAMSQSQPDFQELLAQYCDGQLTDAQQLAWFAEQLRGSADRRQEFYNYHDLHAELYWLESASARAVLELPPAEKPLAELPAASWWRRSWETINTIESVALIVATLTMAIIVLSLALWMVPDWRSAMPADSVPSVEFVARISNTSEAAFDETSDGNFQNRDLFDDDKIVLTSGLAVIEYDTGARVVLEGPATYQMQGRDAGDLRRGKLLARVDTSASQGFIVKTPSGSVRDLGTEFAIEVHRSGAEEYAVLKGEVEVVRDAHGDRPIQRMRLKESEAAFVKVGSPHITKRQEPDLRAFVALRSRLGQQAGMPSQPGAITFLGTDTTTAGAWRSTSVSKPPKFDPNGDNVYGSDGHIFATGTGTAAVTIDDKPAYLSSLTAFGPTYKGEIYVDFDNPALEQAATVSDVDGGLLYGTGTKISFTLASDAKFIITIPLGGSPGHNSAPRKISINQTVGGYAFASAASIPALTHGEYVFFRVDGAAGDAFDINIVATIRQGIVGAAFERTDDEQVQSGASVNPNEHKILLQDAR